ncbi:MAG: hypothetical protein JXB06_12060, partial [Spirochaetales bacterium]|nr:hypothetical protein [Spirochaetales bacterium]
PTIVVDLMYDDTNQVPDDKDASDLRVVMENLPGGTYYIRVTSVAVSDQPYVIRLLAMSLSDTEPPVSTPLPTYDPYDTGREPDDSDIDRNSISFGNDNYVNRYFDIALSNTDHAVDTLGLDWLKFVFP